MNVVSNVVQSHGQRTKTIVLSATKDNLMRYVDIQSDVILLPIKWYTTIHMADEDGLKTKGVMMINMKSKKDRQIIWNIMYAKSTLDIVPIDRKVPTKQFIPYNLKK